MIPQSNPKAAYLAHKEEIDNAIARVMESGWYILGKEVNAFEQEFSSFLGAQWAVGVANGTDAIELALRACGVSAGDGVITVSHTAVATVSAISRIGARALFADIDIHRYTLDSESLSMILKTEFGARAKALVVVHLYGQPADMPAIMELARSHGLAVVEDCAQAHGAQIMGCAVGTWGDFGCFSFYPTKNLGALGDGGAIVGNDPELQQKVRWLREYGWRTRYVSDTVGFNSRLDELQAAVLRVKLKYLDHNNRRRNEIAQKYDALLSDFANVSPTRYAGCHHVFHQYVIRSNQANQIREFLHEKDISTLVHYPLAVHQQNAFSANSLQEVPLLNTEAIIGQIVSLPMFPELGDEQVECIGQALQQTLVDLQ